MPKEYSSTAYETNFEIYIGASNKYNMKTFLNVSTVYRSGRLWCFAGVS